MPPWYPPPVSLVDIGQEAHGVIAIGQVATGVIAVGQSATGVIAIGQMADGVVAIGQIARGGFCVGMVALGIVSVGMAAVGVWIAGGLVGVGGRRWFGFILPLLPQLRRYRRAPATVDAGAIEEGSGGWVRVRAESRSGAGVALVSGSDEIRARAAVPARAAGRPLLAFARRRRGELVVERLVETPPNQVVMWGRFAFGILALVALSALFWSLIAIPLGDKVAPFVHAWLRGDRGAAVTLHR